MVQSALCAFLPTPVVADAWVGWSVASVCMCLHCKRKTTWAINTKLDTCILYCRTLACSDPCE